MPTDSNRDALHPEHIENPEVSFEKRDLGARGILLFFVILFISGITIHLILWGVYEAFGRITEQNEPSANPMVPNQPAPEAGVLQNTPSINLQRFAEPRLQSDDATDMNRFLWQEAQILDSKPWQDQAGAVHLPIGVAMQVLAQRGLPTRQGSGQESRNAEPPVDQTVSGNIDLSQIQQSADAVAAPGESIGYNANLSEREKQELIPSVRSNQPHVVTGGRPGTPSYVSKALGKPSEKQQ